MQDGLLQRKPFILYNISGFFHHLLEFLKSISNKGFSDPVPFVVVDNDFELEVAFSLLKTNTTNVVTAIKFMTIPDSWFTNCPILSGNGKIREKMWLILYAKYAASGVWEMLKKKPP